MKIEITILTAPIAVSVEQAAPITAEIGGIGTLTVNNYYSEGGGSYILTEADKVEIAALASYTLTDADKQAIAALAAYDDTEVRSLIEAIEQYDDTEIRALITQGDIDVATYFGQEFGKLAGDVGTINSRSLQNGSAIESINTTLLQIPTIQEAVSQNSQSISTINGTLGDIATILDAINGEVI